MGAVMRAFSMVAVSWALALSGWATVPTHERTGMDVGGVLNRALETRSDEDHGGTVATIMRTMVNALVGEAVSHSMDDTDLMMTVLALENGSAGEPSRWRNPRTGNVYSITSRRTYDETGGPCLEYSMEAVSGGKRDEVHGTACRQPDGSWTK